LEPSASRRIYVPGATRRYSIVVILPYALACANAVRRERPAANKAANHGTRSMEDFAYLFRDSAAAYLRGQGDARFRRYEKYYRRQRAALTDHFDLEAANDGYFDTRSNPLTRVSELFASRAETRAIAGFTFAGLGGLLLRSAGSSQPIGVGVVLLIAFVGMRIATRKGRI